MRLVRITISQKAIDHGQRVMQGNPPRKTERMCSCPFFYSTRKMIPDVVMIAHDTIVLPIFGIQLPPDAVEWIEQSDRHYQGLDPNPPKPASFCVIHPL